jgi:hypothetical protein
MGSSCASYFGRALQNLLYGVLTPPNLTAILSSLSVCVSSCPRKKGTVPPLPEANPCHRPSGEGATTLDLRIWTTCKRSWRTMASGRSYQAPCPMSSSAHCPNVMPVVVHLPRRDSAQPISTAVGLGTLLGGLGPHGGGASSSAATSSWAASSRTTTRNRACPLLLRLGS